MAAYSVGVGAGDKWRSDEHKWTTCLSWADGINITVIVTV